MLLLGDELVVPPHKGPASRASHCWASGSNSTTRERSSYSATVLPGAALARLSFSVVASSARFSFSQYFHSPASAYGTSLSSRSTPPGSRCSCRRRSASRSCSLLLPEAEPAADDDRSVSPWQVELVHRLGVERRCETFARRRLAHSASMSSRCRNRRRRGRRGDTGAAGARCRRRRPARAARPRQTAGSSRSPPAFVELGPPAGNDAVVPGRSASVFPSMRIEASARPHPSNVSRR